MESKLFTEKHWDVIVIGAGMAGLLTAFYLKEQGLGVLVLEADQIAGGQTERTTAKITSQHGLKYRKLIQEVGVKKARLYAQANEAAIREYERLIRSRGIECGFQRVPAYLYSIKDAEVLKQEAKAAASVGIPATFTKETELPFAVKGAVCFGEQAMFWPLDFVGGIAKDLEILEHTKVVAVKGHHVLTENARFWADKIVVATHYPLLNVPGWYFLRQHQEQSYVLALSGCKKIKGMYYGIDPGGFSFRQAGEYLLLGGESKRTGETKKRDVYESLQKAAKTFYPDSKEECHWAAQDCMPHDGIPFIGKYSLFTPHLYVLSGFQKWGMTTSMVGALILKDMLTGGKNPYAGLFTPQRIHIRAGFKNFMKDTGVSIKGLACSFFGTYYKEVKDLSCGQGAIVMIHGEKYACYKDQAGNLHKISAKCPHLGCELSWNPDENSWDCPCHGSRFDIDGRLISNPAKHDVGGTCKINKKMDSKMSDNMVIWKKSGSEAKNLEGDK